MAAAPQFAQLRVGEIFHQLEQLRVSAEEMFADVIARRDDVLLVLSVDDLVHALHEEPLRVAREQRVPVVAPDDLDDVPARAAEDRFQLLNDLAVAAHWAVEPLQVAVDYPGEVVESLARRQRDGAEALRLVDLTVAEESPYAAALGVANPTIAEVAVEAGLVDRRDGAQTHRHGGKLPEIRHQPRVRVGGQATTAELAAKRVQLLGGDAPFEVGARVNPGSGVPLKEDRVARAAVPVGAEEVVEADLEERRARREGRDMAAQAREELVGPHHHGHGVPADDAADAALDVAVARVGRLVLERDGVDIGRGGGERERDPVLVAVLNQAREQIAAAARPLTAQHRVE